MIPVQARGPQDPLAVARHVPAEGAFAYPGPGRRLPGGRPLLAALLSLLLPGAGQVYARRPLRGALMLAVTAGLAAGAVLVARQEPADLLRLLVQPRVLLGILAADLVLWAFRTVAVADAYHLAGAGAAPAAGFRRLRGAARSSALLALLAITAAPHGVVAYYDLEAYRALTEVFADDEPGGSLLAAGPARLLPAPPAVRSHEALQRLRAGSADPAPPPPEPPGRLNVLLVGADAGPGRWGLRADTIAVVSLQPGTGRVVIFGIPRNLSRVPLADGTPFPQPLNAVYQHGLARPEAFGGPDPGVAALREAVGGLLGIRIHHYAMVDLAGFVEVVDALGGVTIEVDEGLAGAFSPPSEGEPWVEVSLPPGRHHVDGRVALAYVRAREGSDDYDRMARQRCVLWSLYRETSVPELLRGLPRLAGTLRRSVETDLPLRLLPDLVELSSAVKAREVIAVAFTPPYYTAGRDPAGYPIADVARIRAAARAALTTPLARLEVSGLEVTRTACG